MIELPTINTFWARGLLGLALDPDFETNGYVYLYYTYDNNPADPTGPKTGQLVRVTADHDGAVPGSEVVLLGSVVGDPSQPSCEDFPAGTDCIPADGSDHLGGGLRFSSDGKLFLATGDASWGMTGSEWMVRVQDLDNLAGKILRLNPDGSAPPDNPYFTGDPAANRSKVWAYGLRNPFRFGLQPDTNLPFVGDVGSFSWEEIHVAGAGLNLGWPCYEGPQQHPVHSALSFCQDLYASSAPVADPLYSYSHDGLQASVIAGVFYQGSGYPPEVQGAFFYGDFSNNSISVLKVDENNELLPGSVEELLSDAPDPVDFEVGPDGDIYYLAYSLDGQNHTAEGEVAHIRFIPGNRAPVARASASPRGGLAPLTVQFTSVGSYDPDGDSISFAWGFGDGNSSDQANATHTFTRDGTYLVEVTISDSKGASDSDTVFIVVGSEPPQATITAPAPRTPYSARDVIDFAGSGVDPEDGVLNGDNLRWTVFIHHCEPGTISCHSHTLLEAAGIEGTFIAPDQGDEIVYLDVLLTVTDSAGLTDSASVAIGADTDGDGLLDYEELLIVGTDYLEPDSDDDGTPDGAEDPDGDGCANIQELGNNESDGGRRDPLNPWDFYDVAIGGGAPGQDGQVDLFNDIVGVLDHYAPGGLEPQYDVNFDRGPSAGPNQWNMTAPDGQIDLFNDIVGVIAQFGHDCR